MVWRIPVAKALIGGVLLFSSICGADEVARTSASASARITLTISPWAKFHPVKGSEQEQFCTWRPSYAFKLVITDDRTGRRTSFPGRAGQLCLPVSVTDGASSVMIVAQ